MAWIKSHQTLERHPKVLELQRLSNMDKTGAIGVLHRFWYWVLDYAESGDLSRWPIETITEAIGLDAKLLIQAGWIDEKPCLRVHDWLDYAGEYLRTKYRQKPEKMRKIKEFWGETGVTPVLNRTFSGQDKIREDKIRKEKTKEAPPTPKGSFIIPPDLVESEEAIKDWLEYKRQKGQSYKPKGLEALWRTFRAIPKEQRRESVDRSMANNWAGLFPVKNTDSLKQAPQPKREVIG